MSLEIFRSSEPIDLKGSEERFRRDNATQIRRVVNTSFEVGRDLLTNYQVHHFLGT
jgi:hypothetical protein